MTLSLTCACGARLEIDETFAGQTISCPDCQRSFKAPAPERTGLRTSGFALASFILALVGAFTVLGTLLAILFGALGLMHISRNSDRVTGRSYAITGIVLGILLSGLTVFAYSSIELFGLNNLVGQVQWAGKLDYPGENKEIRRDKEGYVITVPSLRWGIYRQPGSSGGDDFDRTWDDLLLVNPHEDAHILITAHRAAIGTDPDSHRESALRDLKDKDKYGLFGSKKKNLSPVRLQVQPGSTKRPPPQGDVESIELIVEKQVGSQSRTFILRIVQRKGDDTYYVLAGGTRKGRFSDVESELRLRRVMDSFRVIDRGPNWR